MPNAKVNIPPDAFHPPQDLTGQAQVLINETVGWLQDNWLRIVIAVGIAVAIVAVLLAVKKLGERLGHKDKALVDARAILARVAHKTSFWFLVIVAAQLVAGYADTPPLLGKTIAFLFTVGLTFQAAVWVRELVLGFVRYRAGLAEQDHGALDSAMGIIRFLISFTIFAVALILVLGNLGVNVTGLVAGLGVGGIAIGLAAQGVFADLFAAIAILFDRPFRRGDQISFGSSSGTVEAIGLKSTRIRAYTGELRVIANKNLLDKEILNVSGRTIIRISFTISVTYETAPDKLAALPQLLRELTEAEGVTCSRAGFDSFGASSLDFALMFDVPGNDWGTAHAARDRLMVAIVRRFAAEGIGLAYPTQTSYTAAPDGTLIMPYAEAPAARTPAIPAKEG
jgi:small-conductance mechanosensitive channel